ncbi:hypothetical protein vseg_000250 [Gypsophila vaccaria]
MSNSMIINDTSTKFCPPPKMSFSQTCNLLSHFVKENRVFGEGYNRSTMNLFPVKQTEEFNNNNNNNCVGSTINLFPQISGFNSSGKKRASPEPPVAQMTIFYGGKVVVLDDLPADKADEVMKLASRLESSVKMRKVETPTSPVPVSVPVPQAKPAVNQLSNPISIPNQNHVIPATAAGPLDSVARADLPIARKASLHRFLEKRKDRLVGKAPSLPEANPAGGNAWLGLNSIPMIQQKQ